MPDGDLQGRLDAVKQLIATFRMERYVYLTVAGVSILAFLACAGVMVFRKELAAADIVLLFGSTGGIVVSSGRVLRMWSDTLRFVRASSSSEEDER